MFDSNRIFDQLTGNRGGGLAGSLDALGGGSPGGGGMFGGSDGGRAGGGLGGMGGGLGDLMRGGGAPGGGFCWAFTTWRAANVSVARATSGSRMRATISGSWPHPLTRVRCRGSGS